MTENRCRMRCLSAKRHRRNKQTRYYTTQLRSSRFAGFLEWRFSVKTRHEAGISMSMPISAERKMLLSSSSNRQPSHTSPPFLRPYTSLPLHLRRSVNENHHRGSRRQRRERRASLRNARFSRCGVQRRAASGPLRPGTPALGAPDFQGAARSAEPSLARKPPANAANGRRRTLPNTLPSPRAAVSGK